MAISKEGIIFKNFRMVDVKNLPANCVINKKGIINELLKAVKELLEDLSDKSFDNFESSYSGFKK